MKTHVPPVLSPSVSGRLGHTFEEVATDRHMLEPCIRLSGGSHSHSHSSTASCNTALTVPRAQCVIFLNPICPDWCSQLLKLDQQIIGHSGLSLNESGYLGPWPENKGGLCHTKYGCPGHWGTWVRHTSFKGRPAMTPTTDTATASPNLVLGLKQCASLLP